MGATTEQMRGWTGPAVFSFGFRPFFLGGAVWAALAMADWIAMLSGTFALPTALDPVSWHAHEFLFGYLGAIIAGFMMTAVPNWTGRMPIVGWPLAGLFVLWIAGRIAVAVSVHIPAPAVALIDISFAVLLALAMAREILAGRNWRNLIVVALLAVFILANALFHWEAAQDGFAAQGFGLRLGLATAILLIALIGGRILPSFTRNWLVKRGGTNLPAPPMGRFDRLTLLVLLGALLLWVIWPADLITCAALLLAGVLHAIRLARWRGWETGSEPLVLVLHVAYGFVPLGALAEGASILWPAFVGPAPALHLWMAGGIGLMTLAVMTRATLGHTGRALVAGPGTLALYACVVGSVALRVLADMVPAWSMLGYGLSGALWIAGFGGFAMLYGPMLLRPKLV
ncbi:MAG: NnrS family protein [Pseudomonadota bacterium]